MVRESIPCRADRTNTPNQVCCRRPDRVWGRSGGIVVRYDRQAAHKNQWPTTPLSRRNTHTYRRIDRSACCVMHEARRVWVCGAGTSSVNMKDGVKGSVAGVHCSYGSHPQLVRRCTIVDGVARVKIPNIEERNVGENLRYLWEWM